MSKDFFRRYLPYGMKKNSHGEWFIFNRDYAPLGWPRKDLSQDEFYSNYPVRIQWSRLTDKNLETVFPDSPIQKDENGNIHTVFFYNDKTNPINGGSWDSYFEKIKCLSKYQVK